MNIEDHEKVAMLVNRYKSLAHARIQGRAAKLVISCGDASPELKVDKTKIDHFLEDELRRLSSELRNLGVSI